MNENMYYKKREILITSALPYANGSLHLGNILEHIQCDIWSRYHFINGSLCLKICGDDAHGTPIMLHAKKIGLKPKDLIKRVYNEHIVDFIGFFVYYDNYYTTHSIENKVFVYKIFNKLYKRNYIKKDIINPFFDVSSNIFLPDRYIVGQCPKCYSDNQYGDNCIICGAFYDSFDIINPISVISGKIPEIKQTTHYFFCLYKFHDILKIWIIQNKLNDSVLNKLNEWFSIGLKRWDISRDYPYFGFKIPNEKDKYFYVWLDAPIGYISIFENLCNKNKYHNFSKFWKKNTNVELYHFIGKDIIYFHTLFWPAILYGSNMKMPNNVFIHGFLTILGSKMSKSKGTLITASDFLKHIDGEYLRYYYASKLNNSIEDIDLSVDDFIYKINSNIIGKFINIISRISALIELYFDNFLSKEISFINLNVFNDFIKYKCVIDEYYENRNYYLVLKSVMFLCDKLNVYINNQKPWILIKEKNNFHVTHEICTTIINIFKILTFYIKPVLPSISNNIEHVLNISPLNSENFFIILVNHKINSYFRFINRLDKNSFNNVIKF